MTGTPAPRPSSASERKKLIEEFQQAKRSEAERMTTEDARARRRKQLTRPLVLAGLLVVVFYLAFLPPAWMRPSPQPVPTAAEREASIRVSLYLQAQRLEQFRTSRGRLPGTLEEAGETVAGLRYAVLSPNSYELQSTVDPSIRYASTDPIDEFLGESMTVLGAAP